MGSPLPCYGVARPISLVEGYRVLTGKISPLPSKYRPPDHHAFRRGLTVRQGKLCAQRVFDREKLGRAIAVAANGKTAAAVGRMLLAAVEFPRLKQVRNRLPAGGNRIRTIGPSLGAYASTTR